MANGDVTKVAVLGSYNLPGGGNTTTGAQKQNKALIWGEVTCTAADAGIDIASTSGVADAATWPTALGFENIDILEFNIKTIAGEAAVDDNVYFFDVSHDTWLIHALEDVGQSNAIPPTAGDTLILTFWAVGDRGTQGVLT